MIQERQQEDDLVVRTGPWRAEAWRQQEDDLVVHTGPWLAEAWRQQWALQDEEDAPWIVSCWILVDPNGERRDPEVRKMWIANKHISIA